MKHICVFLWILLLTACGSTNQIEPAAASLPPANPYDFSGVHLRLHNDTGQDLTDVVLTIGSQNESIGVLPPNATSDFMTFTAVQQPPIIQATIDQTGYEWTAEANVAEGLIAGGEFTLELTLANDNLNVGFLMENPILHDAQYYVDEMGVSLEEALARLDTQNEDAISALQNQLQTHEAETFAGLWLEHEPEYKIAVAFTHDGEETIQKYVAANSPLAELIEIRPADYTYAQLLADRQTVLRLLDGTGLSVGVGIMVMDNRVMVDVADQTAFDATLAEAEAALPESIVVNTVYEPVGDNPPFAVTPVSDVFMPQLKQRDIAFMEALLEGELVVEDGCLRVRSEEENSLVIWQADYYLSNSDGVLEILDETGTAVARVGEMVYMGGGTQRHVDDAELRQPIPEPCGGPYWRMGEFLPEEYIPNVSSEAVEPGETAVSPARIQPTITSDS